MSIQTPRTDAGLSGMLGFKRDLLAVINELGSPYGLAIKDKLESDDRYEYDEINHGRMYPNLDDLVDDGYVEKGRKDKRTNYYELTERGARAVEAEREKLEPEERDH